MQIASLCDILLTNIEKIEGSFDIRYACLKNTYFSEINITELTKLTGKIHDLATIELTQKLIVLDANVELNKGDTPYDYVNKIKRGIKKKNIWSIEIVDKFDIANKKTRYTIRVAYKELSDQEAKKIHLNIFGLN